MPVTLFTERERERFDEDQKDTSLHLTPLTNDRFLLCRSRSSRWGIVDDDIAGRRVLLGSLLVHGLVAGRTADGAACRAQLLLRSCVVCRLRGRRRRGDCLYSSVGHSLNAQLRMVKVCTGRERERGGLVNKCGRGRSGRTATSRRTAAIHHAFARVKGDLFIRHHLNSRRILFWNVCEV